MTIADNIYDAAIQAALTAGKKILEVYNSDDFRVTEKEDRSPLTLADRKAHETIVSFLNQTPFPFLSEEGRDIPYEERSKWDLYWLIDPLDGTKEFIKRNGEFTVNISLIENIHPVFGVVYAPALNELFVGLPGKGAWLIKNPEDGITLEAVMSKGETLPISSSPDESSTYKVVASRSHLSSETKDYLDKIEKERGELEVVSKGSSLKLCMVASGEADEYPRLGPTMEWDTAAAHAVVNGAGKTVRIWETGEEMVYNKRELLNPWFLVK